MLGFNKAFQTDLPQLLLILLRIIEQHTVLGLIIQMIVVNKLFLTFQ